jgi:hypothetical protein
MQRREASESIDVAQLARCWMHSHEEDADGLRVFRPCDFPFPPSRGRASFDLRPCGEFWSSDPGPDDRSAKRRGRWQLDGRMLTLQRVGQAENRFQVESVNDARLTLMTLQ